MSTKTNPADSGMIPELLYRRPPAMNFQHNITFPAACVIIPLWIGHYFLRQIASSDPSFGQMLDESMAIYSSIPFVSWYMRTFRNVVRRIDGRWLLPGIVVSCRVIIFYLWEYYRIRAVTNRVRAERYAESFKFETVGEWEQKRSMRTDHRLRKEWSYQFKPWWTVIVPLALYPASALWMWFLSTPAYQVRMVKRAYLTLAVEPLLRIVGETVWRYFGFDTSGIRKHTSKNVLQRKSDLEPSKNIPLRPIQATVCSYSSLD
jgi:hypothetical protein